MVLRQTPIMQYTPHEEGDDRVLRRCTVDAFWKSDRREATGLGTFLSLEEAHAAGEAHLTGGAGVGLVHRFLVDLQARDITLEPIAGSVCSARIRARDIDTSSTYDIAVVEERIPTTFALQACVIDRSLEGVLLVAAAENGLDLYATTNVADQASYLQFLDRERINPASVLHAGRYSITEQTVSLSSDTYVLRSALHGSETAQAASPFTFDKQSLSPMHWVKISLPAIIVGGIARSLWSRLPTECEGPLYVDDECLRLTGSPLDEGSPHVQMAYANICLRRTDERVVPRNRLFR